MQRRRAQGLCFNCNNKFTQGHKCHGPQLLLLDASVESPSITCEEVTGEQFEGEDQDNQAFLTQQFPIMDLKDKVPLHGVGIDGPRRTTLKRNPKYVA